MPALHGLYRIHPTTGVRGIWCDSAYGFIGMAESAFPANPGGPAATRQARWQAAINTALLPIGQVTIPVSSIPVGDPRLTTPEPCCSISGSNYVYQMFTVTVTLLTLSPLTYDIDVTSCADLAVRP